MSPRRTLANDVQRAVPSPLLFAYHGSVWPNTRRAVVFFSSYAVLIWLLHHAGLAPNLGSGASSLTTILSMVVGLMVSYRSSSSSERWHEGRRIWCSIQSSTRTLLRTLVFSLPPGSPNVKAEDDAQAKAVRETMSLVVAFAYATKHYLRDEVGENYDDLQCILPGSFLETIASTPSHDRVASDPEKGPSEVQRMSLQKDEKTLSKASSPKATSSGGPQNLPLAILRQLHYAMNQFHLSAPGTTDQPLLETVVWANCLGILKELTDSLTNAERIRDTPIPLALGIHLQQILFLYIAAIPPQVVSTLGLWVVPMTSLAAFTFFGIDKIAEQLSDPFGLDANDLPVDRFCAEIKKEYLELLGAGSNGDDWTPIVPEDGKAKSE